MEGMNTLVLEKDNERYVFIYDEESSAELLQTFGRYAADPELGFAWYDAAILSQKVRNVSQHRDNVEDLIDYRNSLLEDL